MKMKRKIVICAPTLTSFTRVYRVLNLRNANIFIVYFTIEEVKWQENGNSTCKMTSFTEDNVLIFSKQMYIMYVDMIN